MKGLGLFAKAFLDFIRGEIKESFVLFLPLIIIHIYMS